MPVKKGEKIKRFDRDHVLCWIQCDVINGLPKRDIFAKLDECMYDEDTKDLAQSTKYKLYNDALDMCKEQLEEEIQHKRELCWNRLLNLYHDCIENNDRTNALNALKEFAKLGGLYPNDKKVEISSNDSSNVTINFAFSSDNAEE